MTRRGMHEMDVHEITDRVGGRVDDLRDRMAGGLSAEHSPACRELGRTRRSLERLTETVEHRLDDLDTATEARLEELGDRLDGGGSWIARLFWIAVGAGIGTGVAYMMDPDRGRARRAQMGDQLGARARDAKSTARRKADYAAGVAQGKAVETAKDALDGSDDDVDPHTLRQRVQSEVIGTTDGALDVVVVVHNEGKVSLKGRVRDQATEQQLVERTRAVRGVRDVEDELSVTG